MPREADNMAEIDIRDLCAVLRKTIRQLERYREGLIEARSQLDMQAEPDLVRTQIHMVLGSTPHMAHEAEAVLHRCSPAQRPGEHGG